MIRPGQTFLYEGKPAEVLYQLERFIAPGRPYQKLDQYRVEIKDSTIQYMSSRQIKECMASERR